MLLLLLFLNIVQAATVLFTDKVPVLGNVYPNCSALAISNNIPCSFAETYLYNTLPLNPYDSVTNSSGYLISPNWTNPMDLSSVLSSPFFYGNFIDCLGWTNTSMCFGSMLRYPNGTDFEDLCNVLYPHVCACFQSVPNPVRAFVPGSNATCLLNVDGQTYCNGTQVPGGAASNISVDIPVPLTTELYGGFSTFASQLQDASFISWGYFTNESGPFNPSSLVLSNHTIVNLATTPYSLCVVGNNTQVYCLGQNSFGMMIPGSTTFCQQILVFVLNPGVVGADTLHGSQQTMCARLFNGSIECWGLNTYGQRGDGSALSAYTGISRSATLVNNITNRSMPIPSPAVGGIPYSNASI